MCECVCVCVCVSVCVAAATRALEVCAVATCGIPLPEIKWGGKKDIWALTAFQLILHLRLREDEKW